MAEDHDAGIRSRTIDECVRAVKAIEDLKTDGKSIADGPYTKGDMWEMFCTGAYIFRAEAIKAIRNMKQKD